MHGAGRVGGDKFHHDLFAVTVVGAAVALLLIENILDHAGIKRGGEEKVQKSRTRDLGARQQGALQRQMGEQRLRDLTRRGMKRAGGDHGGVNGEVAVFAVGGHLNGIGGQRQLRQLARPGGGIRRAGQCLPHLLFRLIH